MKNKNIIITAAVIVSLFMIYVIFYRPLIKRLRMKSSEYTVIENNVNKARKLIDLSKTMKTNIVMINEKEVSLAIDELARHGKDFGVEFRSIKPREVVKEDSVGRYKMLPVDMEVIASDKQFSDFLGSFDELKKSLIKIDSLEIIPDEKNKSMLKAKIVINIYFSSEGGI